MQTTLALLALVGLSVLFARNRKGKNAVAAAEFKRDQAVKNYNSLAKQVAEDRDRAHVLSRLKARPPEGFTLDEFEDACDVFSLSAWQQLSEDERGRLCALLPASDDPSRETLVQERFSATPLHFGAPLPRFWGPCL